MSPRKPLFPPLSVRTWSVFVFGVVLLAILVLVKAIGPNTDKLTATSPGVVTRVDKKATRKGTRRYIAFVRFEDSDHRTYESESTIACHDKRHFVGQEVVVHYNPYNPDERIFIEGDEDLMVKWNHSKIYLLIGGIVAVLISVPLAAREWHHGGTA